jgi:hypothetical protein
VNRANTTINPVPCDFIDENLLEQSLKLVALLKIQRGDNSRAGWICYENEINSLVIS